jgi:acetoin utilization deacetylase AcuC-like enzyme
VTVLYSCEAVFRAHDTGPLHPERPARIDAVDAGIRAHHLGELLLRVETRPASDDELCAVHPQSHIATIERFAADGGGHIDPDTVVSDRSAELARVGSGTLLSAVERLGEGAATGAFVAVRPPGHHATRDVAMGFCLYNHVAVAAANLAAVGNRVVVIDIDAHHGNGTQDIFYDDPRVMYVSWHQSPHYPNSGRAAECGGADVLGTTMNIPVPPGVTGDSYRYSLEVLVAPAVEAFEPDWMLISAGFDSHRADPLCDLSLSSGDIADLTADLITLIPRGRVAALLEGGYDLNALADCSAAMTAALGGVKLHPEPPTAGGPGRQFVDSAIDVRTRILDGGSP